MQLIATALEIPATEPFKNDVLERKSSIAVLSSIVGSLQPPFVMCIDSPWGTGKTTFLKLWQAHLRSSPIQTLYFDAWTTDFAADPLVAFVSEILAMVKLKTSQSDQRQQQVDAVKSIAAAIAKYALPVGAANSTKDFIEAYEAQKSLIEQFHEAMQQLVQTLPSASGVPRLLVLVDELDRCRPSYALELLECIKHLFDVPNVVFALALDKRQLRSGAAAVYGAEIDAEEYLRRFIDLDFVLPTAKSLVFTQHLFHQFNFDELFKDRVPPLPKYDADHLLLTFDRLATLFELTLRNREHCFTRIRLVMLSLETQQVHPALLAILVVLRTAANDVYRRYVSEHGTAAEVLKFLRRQPGGDQFLDDPQGVVVESFLVAAKASGRQGASELDAYTHVANDANASPEQRARAAQVASLLRQLISEGDAHMLSSLLSNIDLATRLTN